METSKKLVSKKRGRHPKEKNILGITSKESEVSSPDVQDASIGASQGANEALKSVYDEMHTQGVSAWFDDGVEEREMIYNMGLPWGGLSVLEIGCGEGDLLNVINKQGGAEVVGIDYSKVAIDQAKRKYPDVEFHMKHFKEQKGYFNRIVMQGVLEHLDNPFEDLKWMIENLLFPEGGDIITSSPDFINPRGIVWMALSMLGAKMSKTDLNFLHPWDFETWCDENKYRLTFDSCDRKWASKSKMIEDLRQRIPLALKDGNIPYQGDELAYFLSWLEIAGHRMISEGAVGIYRITR